MAVHTYIVDPFTVGTVTGTDVQWTSTGTADGIPFSVQFWQSAVSGMTQAQFKVFLKGLVDAQLFPAAAQPAGPLLNFNGGTFTG